MQTESQLTLFAEDSPVNHLALQVSKEAQMMIDTFGQKCSGLSRKSALDGLLVRMLADSSAWHSKMCRLTWSVKAMKSGRLLFQLVPKMRTTDEIEYGLLPTPTVSDQYNALGAEQLKAKGRNPDTNQLRDFVDNNPTALWATPTAHDAKNVPTESQKKRVTPGLVCEVDEGTPVGMWPTPNTGLFKHSYNGNDEYYKKKIANGKQIDLAHKIFQTENTGRLNPDWVDALMGYPVGWTDLTIDDVTHEITEFVGNPDDSGKPRVTTRKDGRAQRLKQLGNSIVPQVASEIFRAIKEAENEHSK